MSYTHSIFYLLQGKEAHLAVERSAAHDNWDDAEGYYCKYWSYWDSYIISFYLKKFITSFIGFCVSIVLYMASHTMFFFTAYRLGEVLDGRYEIVAAHGKGVYSTVVRAKDLKAGKSEPEEVAIKIIRNNDTMWVLVKLLYNFLTTSMLMLSNGFCCAIL